MLPGSGHETTALTEMVHYHSGTFHCINIFIGAMSAKVSLVPRPFLDFISQLWRKTDAT